VFAYYAGEVVACALMLRGSDTLYGRVWGCRAHFHSLHFEACYYQGIDYCIAHGIARFEPGAQGEHKIARGFRPTPTWSAHWL
ncbi:MAG: GNAT family N-acetyltransferase, partial [Pseudomonas stutzeri]|uniref:peptidogalycan biosysnthesis protein n=1 Tax=Hydrogenophaga sp. TaxID=1904254 RepID=UPI0016B68888